MIAFLLGAIKSEAFFTLISGLIIAIVIFILYNSSWVIRKKKKAEAIQKLKLDSMINVINGTEELKSAIDEFYFIIIKLSNVIKTWISSGGIPEAKELVQGVEKEFMETSRKSNSVINKFIIFLKKDMIINEEDEAVREEIKKIKDIHEKMKRSITEIDIKENSLYKADSILEEILEDLNEANVEKVIEESMENIWKIYKKKLDKEQEDWLDKLLNCFKRR